MSYQSDNMAFNSAMDSLSHYGVLGMKWGVRNADTLRKYEGPQGGERRKTSFSERAETRVTKSGKQIAPASKRQVQRENESQGNISIIERRKQKKEAAKNERKKQKEAMDFQDRYSKHWTDSYNRATDIQNRKLDELNAKYSDLDWRKFNSPDKMSGEEKKKFKAYLTEANDYWQKTYKDTLLEDFGEHPTIGKDWVNQAVNLNMYVSLLDEIK